MLILYELKGNIGGMLGLCLGFSLLSILEILYFSFYRFHKTFNETHDHHVDKYSIFKTKIPNYNDIEKRLANKTYYLK